VVLLLRKKKKKMRRIETMKGLFFCLGMVVFMLLGSVSPMNNEGSSSFKISFVSLLFHEPERFLSFFSRELEFL